MTLTTTLAVSLGPAIAKGILKVWLKDKEFLESIGETLIGLIEKKTDDVFARKKAERQFQEIGDRVAQSLFPLFESEGANLNDGDKNAVALAVADTLEKTPITAAFLLERKLDPTELAHHFLKEQAKATVGFSQSAVDLYKRIIVETSRYITDVASQLPAFTEKSFAEIIKKSDQLIEITNRILDEVKRIRSGTGVDNLQQNAALFETDYRLAVGRKLDELELFGVDIASNTNRRHRLSVAYVTLSVSAIKQKGIRTASDTNVDKAKCADDLEDDDNLLSVDVALQKSKRLLVRGQAGSGKTTLLQWVAVKASTKAFSAPLEEWNGFVPFFIRLRDCVEKGLPKPEDFPSLVAPSISGQAPQGWVHQKLQSGKAILLIDGVDEMREAQRPEVRSWLKELSTSFPDVRIIVSSRPTAIAEGWMDGAEFDDAELQPMEFLDIKAFIEHWHSAVQEGIQDEIQVLELKTIQNNLIKVVKSTPSIRSLATSPLLCAMLCALNRDRQQNLPSDRIELYEACCHMLAERRDKERRVGALQDYPLLSYRQKRPLLEDLAYWYMSNDWSVVERKKAEARLSKRLENMPGLPPNLNGSMVMRLFIERTGLLREPQPDCVDFTHRTFQEFLAAKAAVDEGNIGVLIKNGHDDLWRETIVLAAGLANQKLCEELIEGLIGRGYKEPSEKHSLHLLAVSCLETSVTLDVSVIKKVETILHTLVPPSTAGEARGLASAGDLAVKYLQWNKGLYASQAAFCVRALSLIGTEAALDVLPAYATDSRQTITNALVKAWDLFDRNEFGRKVFGNMRSLQINRLNNSDGIEELKSLVHLWVWNTGNLTNDSLNKLGSLQNLTQLTLGNCWHISDLTPLKSLHSLEVFKVFWPDAHLDLTPMEHLPNLRLIEIIGARNQEQINVSNLIKHKTKISFREIFPIKVAQV